MATFSGNVCNSHVHIDLIVTETSTDVANNKSKVSWKLVGYLDTTSSSYWYSNNYHTISVKINGTTVYSLANTTQKLISIGTSNTKSNPVIIASSQNDIDVAHDSDGGKSCSVSFSCAYRYNSAYTWSASGKLELTDIPRASSISSCGGNTIGSSLNINISRASSTFTHTITYVFGTATGTICTKTTSTSPTWTPPLSLCNQIKTTTSGNCTLTIDTYKGSTKIGTKTYTLTLYIPSSVIPIVSAVSSTPTSTNTAVNGWGIYVQNYSKVKLTITGATAYGSAIASYICTYNGKTYTSTSNVITTDALISTSNVMYITVKDQRGRTSDKYKLTITANAYSVPSLKNTVCQRSTSTGSQSDNGTCIYMIGTSVFSSCASKNAAAITYTITRKTTGASVSSGSLSSGISKIITGFLDTLSYVVKITITDSLGNSKTYEYAINTASISMNLYPSKAGGAAFGRYAEKEKALDVGEWDIYSGKLIHTGESRVHNAYVSAGTAGYVKIATIVLNKTNANQAISIGFVRRGDNYVHRISVKFSNASTASAHTLDAFFTYDGFTYAYMVNSSSATWDLYIQKSETYDYIDIVEFNMGAYMAARCTWTWKTEFAASLPSGYETATWTNSFATNVQAKGDVYAGYGGTNQISLKGLYNDLTTQLDNTGSAVSVATATAKQVAKLQFTEEGLYLICASVYFQANATGSRKFMVTTTANSYSDARGASIAVKASDNGGTMISNCYLRTVTAGQTFYVNAYQTSGSTLSCTAQLRGIRLG